MDSSGTALTSLASGDLLILDHANNRWERVVNLPTTALVSNADIDARILPQARTGNAQTWPTSKVPSLAALGGLTQAQVDLRAAFRFTTLEKTKLAGIPADAERNVKANWDATRGDAEILNKPVIPTLPAAATKAEAEAGTETGTRLWSPLRVKEAIEQLGGDGMGSSSPADFSIAEGRPASAVTITTPATAGTVANPQWTSWNAVGTTAAVSASQAGQVLIAAEVRAERTTPVPGGGGDRILTQARIVRTRGSTDTVLATKDIYGPRNVNTASVQTASKSISSTLVWHDTAVAADTYKVEVRCSSQLVSRTVQFNTANNGIFLAAVSGGGGEGESGLDRSAVDARIAALRPVAYSQPEKDKLSGIAAGAEVNVNADWDAASGDAQILNKPSIPGNTEIDARIISTARTGNTGRWPKNKLPSDTVYTNSQRFTTALLAKLNALPSASNLQFENHPIGSASTLNALSRTTTSLDFVTITAAIASGITANTVVDGSGNALTSLASGDLLILDHDDNRWVRVVNLPTTAVVDQSTVRGFIDGDFVEGLLAGLSGASRLSYTSLKDTPTIPAAQVPSDWDASTGVARILNKPSLVTAWTGLSDTPSALTGQGGKHVAVNSAGNALELVDAPAGGGGGEYIRPEGFSADPSDGSITLNWKHSPYSRSYQTRHKLSSATSWGAWTDRGNVVTHTITGLANSSQYDVEVRGLVQGLQQTPATGLRVTLQPFDHLYTATNNNTVFQLYSYKPMVFPSSFFQGSPNESSRTTLNPGIAARSLSNYSISFYHGTFGTTRYGVIRMLFGPAPGALATGKTLTLDVAAETGATSSYRLGWTSITTNNSVSYASTTGSAASRAIGSILSIINARRGTLTLTFTLVDA